MTKENKPTGFRGVIHFFSCWGFGDSLVGLLGALSAFFWPSDEGRFEWVGVLVSICAIIAYYGIAYLSRPIESDEEKSESED